MYNKTINEADGLSHKVCVKCLGALEFLCDFYDQCHKTQGSLAAVKESQKCEQIKVQSPPEFPDDMESDKENVSPMVKSGIKRKMQLKPVIQRNEKIPCLMVNKSLTINIQESERSGASAKMNNIAETKMPSAPKKMANSFDNSNAPQPPGKIESKTILKEIIISECQKITDQEASERSIERHVSDKNNRTDISKNEKKIMSSKSKPVPAIVKLERNENSEIVSPMTRDKLLNTNKIVCIPNTMQLPKGQSPKSTRKEEILQDQSPPAGDEAEKSIDSNGSNDKKFEKTKVEASMEILRKSVIDKSENGKNKNIVAIRSARQAKLIPTKYEIDDEGEEEEEESPDEIDDEGNVTAKKINKITDLMTEEQKVAIEKFYTVDMSAVDEKIVGEKLIFLDKKKFGCKMCDACYTRQDKCQVHIWGHLEMKPYRCNACDFSTVTVSNIRCHIRKSHLKIKPFACELCEKRYVTSFLLEEHINTHTGSRPYACNVCNFTSASRQVLTYHKTTHKPVKDITCHVCGKEFYSKGRLRAHLIVHNKDKAANMCKFCSIYLCNSEALQRHHANVHSKDYVCNACGKRCKSKKALNNHLNVHSAAKYKCTLCSNVYKSSHILKEHLLKHEGIRKYKCNICQKDFAQQSHLAAHMAVHSDKRFFCPGCNRPFNRHDNMKMHTKRCEAFLAKPELANVLSVRRYASKSLTNVTEKSVGEKNNDSPSEPRRIKTDSNIKNERGIEMLSVPRSKGDNVEKIERIIVESTIPCT